MNGGTEMDVRGKQSSEKRLIDYYYLAEKIECPGEPLVYWYDIEAAPTVDAVEVVHGRWVSVPHKLARVCSVCNRDEPYKFADIDADVYDYCPHCGAKMDGGAD